jgi:hypothetical protein
MLIELKVSKKCKADPLISAKDPERSFPWQILVAFDHRPDD